MKRMLLLIAALCLLAGPALAEYDPITGAKNQLTEIFGYTVEEAEGFDFEDNGIDLVRFWPREHPDWVYTLSYDSYGPTGGDSPFYGEHYNDYPGEGFINEILRRARQESWLTNWNAQARESLYAAYIKNGLRFSTALLDAIQNPDATGAEALQAFLTSCYGPEYAWTPALTALRDALLRENGLTLPREKPPEKGVRSWRFQDINGATVTRTAFYRQAPEELQTVFSHPRLAGWECLCGALWQSDGQFKDHPRTPYGNGLAAFEKDGRRLLALLDEDDGAWSILPLGENALYPDWDFIITPEESGYHITYFLPEGGKASFQVFSFSNGARRSYCLIQAYERIQSDGQALCVKPSIWGEAWTAGEYRDGERCGFHSAYIHFLPYLGACDIRSFPDSVQAFLAEETSLIPAGWGVTDAVHLRARTSSHSKDLGTFVPGALIPVLETLPGNPNPWYRTEIGSLKGYAASNYVHTDTSYLTVYPTVAKTKAETRLRKGTGLLDGSLTTLPAGTKMHLVLEDGGWYLVSVPNGEAGWFMDVNGTLGWVKKSEVVTAGMMCQLDWLE